jgi:signal transduction histidine kinase
LLAGTCLLLVLLVAFVDHLTGSELSFFVFYFIPVSVAAWTLGLRWAAATALLCTLGWVLVDNISGHRYSHPALLAANVGVRWLSYTLMGYFFAILKKSRKELARHAAELEQRVQQRTAKLQERVAELETLSYSVSHNLRAPLRAMSGMADALEDSLNGKATEEISGYVSRIKGSARKMDELILGLVDYVDITLREPELRPVNPGPILAEVLDQHRGAIQQHRVEVQIGTILPQVWGQNRMLRFVFSQVISNALKFRKPGRNPVVTVSAADQPEGKTRLFISDNGCGIAPEHQERIFGLFEQLHPGACGGEGGGTGMGLAIARKCVEKMGGEIGVSSSGVQGATFWIELRKHETRQKEVLERNE